MSINSLQQFRREGPWRANFSNSTWHVNSLRTFVLQENFPMANGAVPELIRGTPLSFSKLID
jgi:hypothetical protein